MNRLALGEKTNKNRIGVAIFSLGLILLLFTFYTAFSVFTNPSALEGFSQIIPETEGGLLGGVFNIVVYVIGALLLWVMGSISGRIAKHGIKIYISTPTTEERTP